MRAAALVDEKLLQAPSQVIREEEQKIGLGHSAHQT
jgi:hypothetical protein